jgi:hypothetical protein
MERESWQKHKVLTGIAHKLELEESAENSQRASGTHCMARNFTQRKMITANLKLV